MSDKSLLEGGCLCGHLRYRLTARPFAADYCHCRKCQKSTGSAVAAWMDFTTDQVSWQGEADLAEYSSTQYARRGFCRNCGSAISYRDVRHPLYISLAIASLDDPEQVKPTYHIYTDSQLSWLNIVDDCKRYPQAQN